ncbi:lipopolysaccharide biosynthesis protein [Oscillatoria sp. HE19RPO]|uniref:lipopolysaccharide biosynthesis protein n=1 Tax=Oscillatoria sp. HE19RPO TaxID=2954806 RepID=UPI0020C3F4F0|nr:oligosaccharide flippase family protein [Oscillatoria sp. HE19RPO]
MLKRNLIANYLGQVWNALMGLAFLPLYIHYIGIESYGLIGLFGVITASLSLLDMGMTPTLSREMARFTGGEHTPESIRDLLRSIEIITFSIAAVIAVTLTLSSHWLASSWLQAKDLPVAIVSQSFSIMGLVAALRFVETIYRSSLVGLQRQVLFNAINSFLATLRGLGSVAILAWFSTTIQAFFLWQGLVSIVTLATLSCTIYSILPKAKRPGRFSWQVLRQIWGYAGGIMGITFLSMLLTQVDKVLLSKLLTLTEYGYYTLAATVAGALYMLISPISQAWFPRLTQLFAAEDFPKLTRTYHQGAQLVTVVLGTSALVLIFFSETFLQLWTQNSELAQHTAPLLRLLVLGNMLNGLMWIPYQTQLAYGWTRLGLQTNIVAVSFIVPAILWMTPRYGAVGAAWAWVSLNAGYVLIGVHFMYRRILKTEKWLWYREDVGYPLISALSVVWIIRWSLPVPDVWLFQLGILFLTFFCTFCATFLSANRVREKAKAIFVNSLNALTARI